MCRSLDSSPGCRYNNKKQKEVAKYMIFKQFQELSLSSLGFGAMRLPLLADGNTIDQQALDRMVDTAMAAGVNYYDTAQPYHGGMSEVALGKSLARYPRSSWYLADKFPGHQNVPGVRELQPEEVFEAQLKRCGVDYFDFYLLHNVNENSMRYYCNPDKHYLEYFLKQKENGRIKHFGFSCHGAPDSLKQFLDQYGKYMEFCQIQLNYLDWKLQDAERKCEILREAGLPVWVMEPVRGGKLASLGEEAEAEMRTLRPEESTAAWAFRWLQTIPQPTVVLSGMSNQAQMEDNIRTFSSEAPHNSEELALLGKIAKSMMGSIPCTACRYCCAGCPIGIDIPNLLNMSNETELGRVSINIMMRYSAIEEGKRAEDCIACGQCREICPQRIDVPAELEKLAKKISEQTTWEEICRQREAAAAANR